MINIDENQEKERWKIKTDKEAEWWIEKSEDKLVEVRIQDVY